MRPAGGGGGWAVTMTVQTTRVRQQIPMKLITTDFRLNPQQEFSSDILSRPEGQQNYFAGFEEPPRRSSLVRASPTGEIGGQLTQAPLLSDRTGGQPSPPRPLPWADQHTLSLSCLATLTTTHCLVTSFICSPGLSWAVLTMKTQIIATFLDYNCTM